MKKSFLLFSGILMMVAFLTLSSFFANNNQTLVAGAKFPYKQAGLKDRQAAAHLLGRFTYGVTPNQIDEVVNMGLEKWFVQQLNAQLPNDSLNFLLKEFDGLSMSNKEISEKFPRGPEVLRMAIKEGYINKDDVDKSDKSNYRKQLQEYMQLKGLRPERELFNQFISQKVLRAVYTNNQLQEVMTDFWFNHFNVSITKPQCAQFIPVFERDAIRPNVFGKFENLVLATAKSPAMLLYLDNFNSSGKNDEFENQGNQFQKRLEKAAKDTSEEGKMIFEKLKKGNSQGLNENYAREVMELHTLGVDGGYTQNDVTQAARVLTGWTIYPISDYGQIGAMKKVIERIGEDKLTERGFVHEGDFLFAINRHDNKTKTVLGQKFDGGGYNEGVQLLTMLANHKSTANFISKKLAIRFVSDNPPQSLIDKMAKTFLSSQGDIRQVLLTMVTSVEFWNKDVLREKIKSPFELAISTIRVLGADVKNPIQLNQLVTKMGQQMYYYQAPTGFPDKAQYWINTGSLLNRMNFGLALAAKKVPGIYFDLAVLNHNKEPESAQQALEVYCKLLMPERNVTETVKRLTPLLTDPNLIDKVKQAASKNEIKEVQLNEMDDNAMMGDNQKNKKERFNKNGVVKNAPIQQASFANSSMLSQVVGIIIGSPEFQRK